MSHNELGNKDWTRSYRPWLLIYIEEFATKKDAMFREKMLKGGQGRAFIRNEILPCFLNMPGSYPPEADVGSSPAPATKNPLRT